MLDFPLSSEFPGGIQHTKLKKNAFTKKKKKKTQKCAQAPQVSFLAPVPSNDMSQGISNFKSLEAWKKMKISLILILLGYPEIFRVFSFSGAFLRNHRKRMETIGKLGMPLTGCLGFLKGTSYSIT